jgi:Leucine-rich repeat (LRR) protein
MYDYQKGTNSSPPGPDWLRKLFGENLFSEVNAVHFLGRSAIVDGAGSDVTDDGLVNLNALPTLQMLGLSLTPKVTDAGLANLRGLTRLNWLALNGTKVTDAGLMNLRGLTRLEHLFLGGNNITDGGLENLKELTQLRELSLGEEGHPFQAVIWRFSRCGVD